MKNQKSRKEYFKRYYQEHKEKMKNDARRWLKEHLEKRKKWVEGHKEKCKEYQKKAARKWRLNNHLKLTAHRLAQAIPLDSKCLRCGSTNNLERHHPDYNQPLLVQTLCHKCNLLIAKYYK